MHGLHGTQAYLHLKKFSFLVDYNNNYQQYRQYIGPNPALPFLLPLVREARAGNMQVMKAIFSFTRYKVSGANVQKTLSYRLFPFAEYWN